MKTLPLLLLVALIPTAALADPVSEMAGFSVFGKVDLGELAHGEIKTAASPPMSTPRYLSVQSCFVVPRSPAQVVQAMKQFNPTAHRELKVYLHSDLPSSPWAANFSKLQNPPNSSPVKALTAATEKMSPELQLSRAEAQKFSAGKPVFAFWTDVLTKRAQDFVHGGARAEATYDHTGAAVQPGQEFSGLVRQQGQVNKQFGSFLGATGLIGGRGSLKPDLYWELLQVEDDGVLTLGASYKHATSGGGYQVTDGLYYASGGYYVSLTLYQLWPVNVGGRASTLVWRGDFISAASLGELHGIERIASEGAMKKEISKAVSIFKSEAGR
ncbi:MAG TPA: hypothetical protein VGI85_02060 [Chthoniobacterales bacterium]|jgi:hypothetical protein